MSDIFEVLILNGRPAAGKSEIIDFLNPIRTFDAGVCHLIENSPVYLPEHMKTLRQFTSVITLTLKVIS